MTVHTLDWPRVRDSKTQANQSPMNPAHLPGILLRGLEDGHDDVFHVPDHAGNQEKEKHEHHEADGEAHLQPVSLLLSHHAENVAPAELAF